MPLYKDDLEHLRDRSRRNDEWMGLIALCHPEAGLSLCYEEGSLLVACHKCEAPVADIAVAERPNTE